MNHLEEDDKCISKIDLNYKKTKGNYEDSDVGEQADKEKDILNNEFADDQNSEIYHFVILRKRMKRKIRAVEAGVRKKRPIREKSKCTRFSTNMLH